MRNRWLAFLITMVALTAILFAHREIEDGFLALRCASTGIDQPGRFSRVRGCNIEIQVTSLLELGDERLVTIPNEWADSLRRQEETGLGYHVVSVSLRDGRRFDQVVASEGGVIQVRGYSEVPFQQDEVASVHVNHRRWNFRVADSEFLGGGS